MKPQTLATALWRSGLASQGQARRFAATLRRELEKDANRTRARRRLAGRR